jgi:hypothetical protein
VNIRSIFFVVFLIGVSGTCFCMGKEVFSDHETLSDSDEEITFEEAQKTFEVQVARIEALLVDVKRELKYTKTIYDLMELLKQALMEIHPQTEKDKRKIAKIEEAMAETKEVFEALSKTKRELRADLERRERQQIALMKEFEDSDSE